MNTTTWTMPLAEEEDWEEELAEQNAFLPIDYYFICPIHTLKHPVYF